jgi:hypothetical protein
MIAVLMSGLSKTRVTAFCAGRSRVGWGEEVDESEIVVMRNIMGFSG